MSAPTLDRLAILDEQGRRQKLHPADVDGRFQRLKPFVRWGLIGLFVALPWISIGGHPAVLFDLPVRRFYLFGSVYGTADLPFLFFLLMAGSWCLVVTTALWGRVWCGWACPQTVYLEGVFRRLERLLEGTGAQRLAFDSAPWSARKLARKAVKWGAWALASFVIAHVFLSYFVSIPRVVAMVSDAPTQHWGTFLVAAFATGITYFNFAWFREQTCLIICPYGRLQSALQDRDSIVVGYDKARGEPRGKPSVEGVGDCVDCKRCIAVCPTGIDIRNGLQMECIGCAACIDACDAVMAKLHRAPGLIRYDSERGLGGGKRRVLRPRIAVYLAAGALLAAALVAFDASRRPLAARVVRPAGIPWQVVDGGVRNAVLLHIENRSSVEREVSLEVSPPPDATAVVPMARAHLEPQQRIDMPVVVTAARGGVRVPVRVVDGAGAAPTELRIEVLGPRGVP